MNPSPLLSILRAFLSGLVSVSAQAYNPPPDSCSYNVADIVLDTARSFTYVRETRGYNRSPDIDRFNETAGVPLASSWCMSYAFSMWDYACKELGVVNLFLRTGGVARQLRYANKLTSGLTVVPIAGRLLPALNIPRGSMLCRKNKGGTVADIGLLWLGHVGLKTNDENEAPYVSTIEGNTSASASGSQRDGDGVARKKRRLDWFIAAIVHPERIVKKPC